MSTATRGFASMTPDRRRECARLGGIAAQRAGTAHRWTPEEARAAGLIGGPASAAARRDRQWLSKAREAALR